MNFRFLRKPLFLYILGLMLISILLIILLVQNAQLRAGAAAVSPIGEGIQNPSTSIPTPSRMPATMPPSSTPITPIPPSLTPVIPTPGPDSPLPPSANYRIEEEITPQGMYLNISGIVEQESYRLGPVAKGAYAISPNDRFLVYLSHSGQLYAIRLGQSTFTRVTNMARQFTAIKKNIVPSFSFSFYDNGFSDTVIITESHYDQTIPVLLPRSVTY